MGFDILVTEKLKCSDISKPNGKWNDSKYNHLLELYNHIKDTYDITDALIIDKNKSGKVKINRKYYNNIPLPLIKKKFENPGSRKELNKIEFGNGSIHGEYQGGGGFKYEKFVFTSLVNNLDNAEVTQIKSKITINENTKFVYKGRNKVQRPLRLVFDKLYLKNNNADNISDIDIINNGIIQHISLKKTNLVAFMGIGTKKYLIEDEIKKGDIENNVGKKLLSVLNIDNKKFCQVFNNYHNNNISTIKNDSIKIQEKSSFADELYEFIREAVCKDYWVLHKINNEVKFYWVNDIIKDLYPKSCIVYYGGKSGKAKQVNIIVKTEIIELNFNIRHKNGGIYPTHINCNYNYL